jgi:hypothetical protein
VTLHVCDVLGFSDGRLREQRTYLDGDALMAQIDVSVETPAKTPPVVGDPYGIGHG